MIMNLNFRKSFTNKFCNAFPKLIFISTRTNFFKGKNTKNNFSKYSQTLKSNNTTNTSIG